MSSSRLVTVEERERAALAGFCGFELAKGGLNSDIATDRPHAGAHQRDFDDATLAGAPAFEERRQDARHGRHARHVIAEPRAHRNRFGVFWHQIPGDTGARPERADVVARTVGIGAVEAVTRDGRVDEFRMARAHLLVIPVRVL